MIVAEWTAADGWLDPKITPYQNLSLDPATCVFHYAFECFEGMKAYKVLLVNKLFHKYMLRCASTGQQRPNPAFPTRKEHCSPQQIVPASSYANDPRKACLTTDK